MPTSTVLFRTSSVTVVDVRCAPGHQPVGPEEVEDSYAVVLPRRGVFVYHVDGERMVADPTIGFFLNRGDVHRTTHPTSAGDHNTVISFDDAMADELVERSGRFPGRLGDVPLNHHLRHHEILKRVVSNGIDQLEVDEWAMKTVDRLTTRPLPAAKTTHVQLVADAREYLASNFSERADLRAVARAVGSSPYHLSRVFHRIGGNTMSAYRTELRLRHVVDAVAGGHRDLATLAMESGFHDHAHLTNTMRRHAGITPSQLRLGLERANPYK